MKTSFNSCDIGPQYYDIFYFIINTFTLHHRYKPQPDILQKVTVIQFIAITPNILKHKL